MLHNNRDYRSYYCKEMPCVQVKDARLALETVIRYFEQQSDSQS